MVPCARVPFVVFSKYRKPRLHSQYKTMRHARAGLKKYACNSAGVPGTFRNARRAVTQVGYVYGARFSKDRRVKISTAKSGAHTAFRFRIDKIPVALLQRALVRYVVLSKCGKPWLHWRYKKKRHACPRTQEVRMRRCAGGLRKAKGRDASWLR